jgi:hypothetical protein
MRCIDVQAQLPAFQEGEVAEPLASSITRHLASCQACRHELALLEQTWDALDAFEAAVAPKVATAFEQRFWAQVAHDEAAETVPAASSAQMVCGEIVARLPAMEDGALSLTTMATLHAHLDACTSCAAEQRALERTWDLLDSLPGVEPSPTFVARFWQRVHRPSVWQRVGGWWERALVPAVRGLASAPMRGAAMAMVVMLVVLTSSTFTPRPNPPSDLQRSPESPEVVSAPVPPAVEEIELKPVLPHMDPDGINVLGDMPEVGAAPHDAMLVPAPTMEPIQVLDADAVNPTPEETPADDMPVPQL